MSYTNPLIGAPPAPTGPMSPWTQVPRLPTTGAPAPFPTFNPGAIGNASTATAARAGFLGQLAGSGGGSPTWLTQKMAGQSTKGLGLRSAASGSLGRAGLYGLAGTIGKGAFDSAIGGQQDGVVDDVIGNAIAGAGLGAGVGSIVPGVGTAIGAAVGTVGGGLFGALRGGDSAETNRNKELVTQSDRLERLMMKHGVSMDARDEILSQFALSAELAGSKDDVKAISDQIIAQLPVVQMADKEQRAIDKDARQRQSALVAMQSWLGPLMQDNVTRANAFADELSGTMMNQAAQIGDPSLRAAAQARANRVPLDVASQNAYMLQQTMLTPQMYGFNTQQNNQGVGQIDPMSVLGALPVGFDPNAPAQQSASASVPANASGDQLLAQILGAQPAG